MTLSTILQTNLLSPITLSFALGVLARRVRSEFTLPKDIYMGIAVYLLFALGLKGGAELAHAPIASIAWPAGITILLGCITPLSAYFVLRKLGGFSVADSAGIAAHYGSVSAVTYIAAQTFLATVGEKVEGYMPTLLALLESPGIHIALALGAIKSADKSRPVSNVLHEVLTARTMVLLVGGLIIGYLIGEKNWHDIESFYDTKGLVFKGALCLFLLEMGIVAGDRLGDLKKVGPFLLGFGILLPIIHGALGVLLGHLAGLSVGGCTVLATMAASASYIAAPPAVRVTLPEANPTYSLTCALAITFPFNILAGIPLYYQLALMVVGKSKQTETEKKIMQLVSLKLVTIIAETVLTEWLTTDLTRLGAKGFTVTEARGEGSRHLRAGEIPGQNVKIESVVSETVASLIVSHVAKEYFSHYAVIVYVSDVAVVRGEKYV